MFMKVEQVKSFVNLHNLLLTCMVVNLVKRFFNYLQHLSQRSSGDPKGRQAEPHTHIEN